MTQTAPLSYRDIKRIVLDRIHNRQWPPDTLLPTEADLVTEFSSTRTTINRALRELAEEGYLERKRKAGTRVLGNPIRQARFTIPVVRDEVEATGATYRYSHISTETIPAPAWLLSRLALPKAQDILHVRSLHYADNRPFQYEDRWIVPASVSTLSQADFTRISPNEWLVQAVPFTDLELTFTAIRADRTIAEFLGTTEGEPIFTSERLTWLQGQPVTLARMYFHPGYRMTTRL